MMKNVSKGVFKRVSIMDYFTTRKRQIFLDKVNFCNKCLLERITNRAEGCYVCTNCGECEFCFVFPAINGRITQYSYKAINHLKVRLRRFQAVESKNVPEKVYDVIKSDLRKRRIRWDGAFTTGSMTTLEILKKK